MGELLLTLIPATPTHRHRLPRPSLLRDSISLLVRSKFAEVVWARMYSVDEVFRNGIRVSSDIKITFYNLVDSFNVRHLFFEENHCSKIPKG